MLTCRDGHHCPRIATATKRAAITALVLVSMLGSVLVSAAPAQTGDPGLQLRKLRAMGQEIGTRRRWRLRMSSLRVAGARLTML